MVAAGPHTEVLAVIGTESLKLEYIQITSGMSFPVPRAKIQVKYLSENFFWVFVCDGPISICQGEIQECACGRMARNDASVGTNTSGAQPRPPTSRNQESREDTENTKQGKHGHNHVPSHLNLRVFWSAARTEAMRLGEVHEAGRNE
jgi:hypothetical protein